MPRLIMKRGPEPNKVYELSGDLLVVGRGSKSDIVIQDNEVSRSHCRFVRVMADYELEDMESANGTFVNGQRVAETWLLQNDCIIELGDSITFHFEHDGTSTSIQAVQETLAVAGSETETDESEAIAPLLQPYLIVSVASRPDEQEVFLIEDAELTLGRDLSNKIVIQEPEISRFHLKFTRTDDSGYKVQDLGSTNGTTLNGISLQIKEDSLLKFNDVLQVGTMVNMLYAGDPATYKSNLKTEPLSEDKKPRPTRETVPVTILGLTNPVNKRKTTALGTGLEPGALETHIFISYAREDWELVVAPLTLSLQDARMSAWVDQYLTRGKDDWMAAVEQALSECWLMVVIVSPQSMNDKNITTQYRYFYNRERAILPFVYQPVDPLPSELVKQRVVRYDEKDPAKSFQRLIFEIMHSRRK